MLHCHNSTNKPVAANFSLVNLVFASIRNSLFVEGCSGVFFYSIFFLRLEMDKAILLRESYGSGLSYRNISINL